MHQVLENENVGGQIMDRLTALSNRLAAASRLHALSLKETHEAARNLAQALAGKQGEQEGRHTAMRIMASLADRCEIAEPEFWGTELGQAVAWWTGGHGEHVSRAIAGAVLGCSRQNVHKLTKTGALEIHEADDRLEDLITTASLRAELHRRYPLDLDGASA